MKKPKTTLISWWASYLMLHLIKVDEQAASSGVKTSSVVGKWEYKHIPVGYRVWSHHYFVSESTAQIKIANFRLVWLAPLGVPQPTSEAHPQHELFKNNVCPLLGRVQRVSNQLYLSVAQQVFSKTQGAQSFFSVYRMNLIHLKFERTRTNLAPQILFWNFRASGIWDQHSIL